MAQPTEYEQVTYNSDDGAQVGNASTTKLAFYGSAPMTKPTISSAVSTTSSNSTNGFGFCSNAELLQVVHAVSSMAYQLKQLGLVA